MITVDIIAAGREILARLNPRRGGGGYLTETEMSAVRAYLASVGATRVHRTDGIVSWSYGRYEQAVASERWTSLAGHQLRFKFAGPSPVDPERNGWHLSWAHEEPAVPEWDAADAAAVGEADRLHQRITAAQADPSALAAMTASLPGGTAGDLEPWEVALLTDGATGSTQAEVTR